MSTNPLAEKYVGKYLGPDKIVDAQLTEMKTPSGGIIIEFTTQRTSDSNATYTVKELVPEKAIAIVVGDTPLDYTKTMEAKMNALVPALLDVIDEYNIEANQVDLLVRGIKGTLDARMNRALNYLFSGDDSNYIPGWDAMNDVSILSIMKVLDGIPKKDGA